MPNREIHQDLCQICVSQSGSKRNSMKITIILFRQENKKQKEKKHCWQRIRIHFSFVTHAAHCIASPESEERNYEETATTEENTMKDEKGKMPEKFINNQNDMKKARLKRDIQLFRISKQSP